MSQKKSTSESLTDQFVDAIQKKILSGELKAGDQLPSEREMAERMDVSLAVINGGVLKLQERGLLRVEPRRGVFVADYLHEGSIETLQAIIQYGGENYSDDIMGALATFRRTFEVPVNVAACEVCSDEDLELIYAAVKRYHEAKSTEDKAKAAFEVHRSVAASTGNVVYALVIASFEPIYVASYHASFDYLESLDKADAFCDELADCIRDHDVERMKGLSTYYLDGWERISKAASGEGGHYRSS